jgi:hypothetical protein
MKAFNKHKPCIFDSIAFPRILWFPISPPSSVMMSRGAYLVNVYINMPLSLELCVRMLYGDRQIALKLFDENRISHTNTLYLPQRTYLVGSIGADSDQVR